jgi:replicative DNA helicase
MARTSDQLEADFLGSIRIDNEIIDKALQAGLTPEHFADAANREQWKLAVSMRTEGAEVSDAGLYAKGHSLGLLDRLGGMERLLKTGTGSSLGYEQQLAALLDVYAKREAYKLLKRAVDGLAKQSLELGELRELADGVTTLCAGKQSVQRSIADIDAEIEADVKAAQEGKTGEEGSLTWGLKKLDTFLRPIRRHEYVLVCARPSRGKSSMLSWLAGANLGQGKRVAYFTLETSDKAVVQQMAGQLAGVRLDSMPQWMPDQFRAFNKARASLRDSKRLMVFDRDMSLDAIIARCRLLAGSFKPDLVVLDYLGLVATSGRSPYERVSLVSKAMIPLRKALQCPLVVGQQLNRAAESQEREPTLGDLRDSGQLEEDAHRCVMLHWKDSQFLDKETRAYKILQPKLRDGRTTAVDGIEFHAPTTSWREAI